MQEQIEVEDTQVKHLVDTVFRQERSKILAVLVSSIGDFEVAEDALQDALIAALEHWQGEGVPHKPEAWLLTIARHKAIDRLRRLATTQRKQSSLQALAEVEQQLAQSEGELEPEQPNPFPDERLKLIFTCCHPAINLDARVALTLHLLGGLSTAETARAFLVSETTMFQRLVRAKRKIRDARIPYVVPSEPKQLAERLEGVRLVLYLIFNAGYIASLGNNLLRQELCQEAIRLTRSLIHLLNTQTQIEADPETMGLLALMLLHDARSTARLSAAGELLILEEQDRALWKRDQITEGEALLDQALLLRKPGMYQIQAAISALHCQAARFEDTDWFQIALLYAELVKLNSSAVLRLNWAVAVAMATTAKRGLGLLAELETDPNLKNYYLFYAARADLLRRNGEWSAAKSAYQEALSLTDNQVERGFLQRRYSELEELERGRRVNNF